MRFLPEFKKPKPAGVAGQAVFLNNTASSYHWGCFATSMMLYNGLTDRGFSITSFDVETTHFGLGASAPSSAAEIDADAYLDQIRSANPMLLRAIEDCDLVVVNGEGTLHRFHNGPRALLSVMRMAKVRLGKRVHLVNHSCFPSGAGEPADSAVEEFYRECLAPLDRIVARDLISVEVYKRLGIKAEAGFDCLPLYHDRYLKPLPKMPPRVLLGAASNWHGEAVDAFSSAFSKVRDGLPAKPVFLSGGFRREPPEDAVHYEAMRSRIPDLEIIRPSSISEWLGWIESSPLMITGRFHHLVSAAALRTPVVVMPGNTTKNDAMCDIFKMPTPIRPNDEGFEVDLLARISKPAATTPAQVRSIVRAAEKNILF